MTCMILDIKSQLTQISKDYVQVPATPAICSSDSSSTCDSDIMMIDIIAEIKSMTAGQQDIAYCSQSAPSGNDDNPSESLQDSSDDYNQDGTLSLAHPSPPPLPQDSEMTMMGVQYFIHSTSDLQLTLTQIFY